MATLGLALGIGFWPLMGGIMPALEVTQVACVADVAGSLNGKYFIIYDSSGSCAVWLNSGGSSAPGGYGRTLEVAYTADDVAADVAAAVYAVIVADPEWITVQINAETFIVSSASTGERTDAEDVDTGFTITTLTQGA